MRKLRRSVAHFKMEKLGLKRVNKGARFSNGDKIHSFFRNNWVRYTQMPIDKVVPKEN